MGMFQKLHKFVFIILTENTVPTLQMQIVQRVPVQLVSRSAINHEVLHESDGKQRITERS